MSMTQEKRFSPKRPYTLVVHQLEYDISSLGTPCRKREQKRAGEQEFHCLEEIVLLLLNLRNRAGGVGGYSCFGCGCYTVDHVCSPREDGALFLLDRFSMLVNRPFLRCQMRLKNVSPTLTFTSTLASARSMCFS